MGEVVFLDHGAGMHHGHPSSATCACDQCLADRATLRWWFGRKIFVQRMRYWLLRRRWYRVVDEQDCIGLIFLVGALWGSFLTILTLLAIAGWRH